ncbi:metallophosphoesterase [Pseudomonas viridiflava]|uniref:metallophosphoesterase family protein n=1 Tax=Pseudomonas viridiflava TaxID=33069 RepID=UPI001C2DE266|nr:metallophosphoesterase [Pseudomonas viridiflava]MBV1813508.1 metallophosphoesterase [Pseudomonas viridiflava]
MERSRTFNWLHISDFHFGTLNANRKWEQIRSIFHADIEKHLAKSESIDLVVFSGDLTEKGLESEFNDVFNELCLMWNAFREYDQDPYLFVVPGNHDLIRPKATAPILLAIKNWGIDTDLEDAVFTDQDSAYAQDIKSAFAEYTRFISKLESSDIKLALDREGAIPGDGSASLEVRGRKVGIVGLNTAWSHLKGGDLKSKLLISDQQIHGAVTGTISSWIAAHDINLLVTHHPDNWLTNDSAATFRNEINPLNRFSAHLFGHMHESITKLEDFAQGTSKLSLQSASLFGLERFAGNKHDRRHGYYYAQVDFEKSTLQIWPKHAELISGAGGWRMRAETTSLPDNETESVVISLKINNQKKK